MRKSRIKPILIAFTAVFLFQHSIVAQSYDIPSSVVGNGGESVTSANYDLTGTVGQAVTGTGLSSSSYQHGAGFWPAVSPPLFVDISAGLLGVFDGSVAWGDFDNDGDLDILLTGDSDLSAVTSNAAIYTNGSFTQSLTAVLTGTYNGDAAWGDYDNDGDLDVVITGYTGTERIAKVYRNNGDATLTDVGASITGVNLSSVAWGDYDNDGDLDLAITGFNGSTRVSQIYENTDGSFSDISAGLPGVTGGSVAWGDYDEDGDLDLLMTGDNTGTSPYIASIYKNTDGTFTDISASFTGVFNGTAQWGDYDNDGDLDVLVTGDDGTSGITKLYRNDVSTGGSFTEMATAGFTGVSYSSAAWGDYDNDGDLDVALAGGLNIGRHTAVYRNNGNDTFSDIGANLTTVFHSSVAWGDYDNDGDLDLLVSGQTDTDALTKVYRNDAQTANTAPSVPSSPTLINVISENSADLSWAKFTDTETAQNALTYNVRVGTSPGGVETVSPMAFTSGVNEGRRKVPAMGNAGQRTSWTVKNLPDGTYYWSLQAIDNGFTGSSFAPEVTFAIDIAPGAPAGLTASAGDGEIVLTWNKNSEGDVAKYRVYGDIASSPTTQVDSTTNAGDTTTTLTGLTNGQTYYYRVTAVDTGGNESGYSNEIAATPGDETAPSAPTGVVAEAGDTEITLTWNQNPETDVGKYRIYGDTSPAPVTKVDSTTTIGDTTRTITGLINYTTYYYRITAVDNAGNESGYSAEVSIAPRDLTPPAAPTGLVAEAGDRQVTLTWNRNDEDDADKYRIYGGTTPAPTTPVDSTLSPGDTTKTITGLANGTTYYYHITAVDTANNESNFSNEVNVTPGDNTPPAAPTGLIAQAGDGQVKLTWAENTEGDVVKYRIYGDTSPGPVDQVDSTTSVNDTTRTLTGLINDITYYYRLTAVDTAENESDFSSEASATPGAGNVAPAVTLLSPNGGQLWSEDHFHLIRWQATDDDSVTRISLLYSPDGGINYTSIRDSLVNDGRFRWRIPRGPVTTAMVKVIAYDAEGVSAEDESDGVFTIEDVSTHVLATGAISHTIRNDGWTGALGGSVGTTTTTSILGLSGSSSHEGTVSKKSTRAEVSSPGRNLRTESRNISSTAGSTEPSLEFPPGSGNHHLFIGQFLFAFVNDVLDTFAVRLYGDDFLPLYPIEVYPETDYVETWTGYGDRLDLDIDVEEATFSATDEPFIIQEYTLYNWSGETYSNLYLASFADFDISDYTVNLSGYEAPDRLAFMYNDLGDWGYAGIRMLDQDPTVFRRWGGGVFTPVTEGQIFRALSSPGIDNTSGDSPDDYRIVEALGPFTLPSDDSLRVAFALVAGADLTALRQASRRAQAFWDEINEVTRTISGNVTYPGFEQNYPNGELFVDVWEDPSEWPFPPEGPVTTVFIGPPVDFMNPVPYVIDDPILQPGHDYYVGAVFDEDNTFQPPTPEAEAWYGTDLASGKINLDAGSVTGIDLPLVPIAGAVGLWIGDVGTDFIDLNWDRWPDVDSDFNRYEIHRNNSGNVTLADPTVLNEPNVNVTSWRDVDVVEGQDYYYKLWMFDQAGIRYETMEVWATPGVMGHVDGTITSTETGSGELVVGLFEPGNESPWSPDFERSFPGTSFPGDYFYVFDEPGIYDAFGWEVRAFLDENQNFFPDQGEMKGKSGEFEISGGAAFDIDFAVGYPPVGTGSISGDLIASKAADGQLYLALWFPASDPDMDPPDIVQPEVYVDFQSPGATWFYEFTDLPDGNGYTVAAFLDQAGSAGVGPDTCDPGEDLAGMRRGISISGGVQVTNQDVNLEDCSQFEPEIPIPDAVDNVSLDWYTGGDQPWFGQGTVTHDGIDAAQSGAIGDDGDSWLDADIEINGAGTVSFWWKVSSEDGGDFLRLYEEGNEVDAISGEVDWQQGSLNVCDYTYVSWSYEKNSSGSAGDDAGWLDEVTFTPGLFGTGQVSAFLDDIFLVGEVGEADTFNLGFENSGDGPVVITNITSSEPDL
ncbi:MAG: FG-GAP-like repeat-containing protein, partial [Fidelibacterota bacterium]